MLLVAPPIFKMNILYYVSKFPKLSESFVLNEISELEKRGHNIIIYSEQEPNEDIRHDEVERTDRNVYYSCTPELSSLPFIFDSRLIPSITQVSPRYLTTPKSYIRHLFYTKSLFNAIETIGSLDLIHAHFAAPSRIAAFHATKRYKIPYTITAHATEIFANPDFHRIRKVCEGADHVVVPSAYNKEYLQEKVGVKNSFTVVPATTEVEKFNPTYCEVEGRILTVGRLVEKKGIRFGLEAVSLLQKEGIDVEYHIIGEGEQGEFLQSLARELNIRENVSFLGSVTDQKLQRELSEASIFLLPCVIASNGDRDAMPVVLKEAMAAKTACVSTTVSAIPELITNGDNGILAEPRNVRQLSQAMKILFRDPAKRSTIAEAGFRTVRDNFDIENSVDILENVFRQKIG